MTKVFKSQIKVVVVQLGKYVKIVRWYMVKCENSMVCK